MMNKKESTANSCGLDCRKAFLSTTKKARYERADWESSSREGNPEMPIVDLIDVMMSCEPWIGSPSAVAAAFNREAELANAVALFYLESQVRR
jgi:hypothetical protein